ncbi:MAG: enoyl-CoA hydratase-related protein [Chloroflexota bacterium]|nr:enoyl-CoA hydratase-related protein [Chloroflexota bacterium]
MTTYNYRHLKVEMKDKVLILTLNRPDALNAMNPLMIEESADFYNRVGNDPDVNVIVMTGAGRAFCAGGDVKGFHNKEFTGHGPFRGPHHAQSCMLDVPQPIIAAVNGDAIGLGATLALFSDIIIASEKARFADMHVRAGLVAGDGGAVIWPLLIGPAKAKEFLMTGDLIPASEAERIGLINRVVPPAELMSTALALAQRLSSGPSLAIRWTKMSVNQAIKQQANIVMGLGLSLEALTFYTEDHAEAAKAFVEKRQPRFKGT